MINMTEIADKYTKVLDSIEYPNEPMLDKETKQKLLKVYREKQQIVKENFMNALICAHDVKNNPKARKVFELAWEHGHASGLHDVENYFEDFVELIQ